jgi:hypothetical protein
MFETEFNDFALFVDFIHHLSFTSVFQEIILTLDMLLVANEHI